MVFWNNRLFCAIPRTPCTGKAVLCWLCWHNLCYSVRLCCLASRLCRFLCFHIHSRPDASLCSLRSSTIAMLFVCTRSFDICHHPDIGSLPSCRPDKPLMRHYKISRLTYLFAHRYNIRKPDRYSWCHNHSCWSFFPVYMCSLHPSYTSYSGNMSSLLCIASFRSMSLSHTMSAKSSPSQLSVSSLPCKTCFQQIRRRWSHLFVALNRWIRSIQ